MHSWSTEGRRRDRSGARLLAIVAAVAFAAAAMVATTGTTRASALSGSSFNPGYIISDQQFYDGAAMKGADIQAFLLAKSGGCDTTNCLGSYRQATPNKPADAMCRAYAGTSSESAASIIYKVQTACGISAKVILVTLEKEQGLVTASAPSAGKLRAAMGYGCPDTAACDSTYYGFFNQVYQAARQLKRYGLGPPANVSFTYYPVGKVSNLRYNPNAACGTRAVTIKNKATAALYYYTPYTPNAAALANLGGTGDSCSSYGNRNFWVFYNTWFGNSLTINGAPEIAAAYAAAGGPTGALGPELAPLNCPVGVKQCVQNYQNGMITWNLLYGAFPVVGDIRAAYLAAGGPGGAWGYATSSSNPITGARGDGYGQNFQGGQVLVSDFGLHLVSGAIKDAQAALGWVRGSLGWPSSDAVCSGSTCAQQFQGGGMSSIGSATYAADDAVGAAYLAAGGLKGSLGYPTSAYAVVAGPSVTVSAQSFKGGQVVVSPDGLFLVLAAMQTAYVAFGGVAGDLGWPTANQSCGPTGCSQQFSNGAITIPTGGSPYAIDKGPIGQKYLASGGITGPLGLPTSGVNPISGVANVLGQNFAKGQILAGPSGAFVLNSAMLTAYTAFGWVRGALGWPIADASCSAAGCSQTFSGGTVTVPVSGKAYYVDNGPIGTKFIAAGAAGGVLGVPTSTVNPVSGTSGPVSGQNFAHGQILASSDGAFVLTAAMLKAYTAFGWVRGALSWPVADQLCTAGNCSQEFVGGTITIPTSGVAYLIDKGPVGTKYLQTGGPTGPLGVPTSTVNAVSGVPGPVLGQNFAHGQILSGPAGSFAVVTSALKAYTAFGWVRGPLKWPTADQSCTSSGCSQQFGGGILTVPKTGSAYYVDNGPVGTEYLAAGGPTGSLGLPTSGVTALSTVNGNGWGQNFAKGQILASGAGAFAVPTSVLTVYSGAGWVRGKLGWPTAEQVCGATGCSQRFQHGTVTVPASGPATVTYG